MTQISTEALRSEIEQIQRRLYDLQVEVTRVAGDGLEELAGGELEIVECRVGDQRIGLLLDRVQEAVRAARLAPLPEAPPWVLGLLTLRGATIPVLDVAARFGRRARELELSDLIVICSLGDRRVGLVVQEIEQVLDVPAAEVGEPSPDLPHAPYLLGVYASGAAPLTLISIERLVSLSDIPELDS